MADTTTTYRLYLTERIRKYLGINLRNKKVFLFKLNHKTYLSTNVIPKSVPVIQLVAKLGKLSWFIDIPQNHLEYAPSTYQLLNTVGNVLLLKPTKEKNKQN